ncbi:MAG: hypothetical protein ACRD18_14565 [Terriglobia bacterium]
MAQVERQILRVLCQGFHDGPLCEDAWRSLGNRVWHEAEHQVIFSALAAHRDRPLALIREQLPARLTRLGFPDAAWEDLLHPHGLDRAGAEEIIKRWLESV